MTLAVSTSDTRSALELRVIIEEAVSHFLVEPLLIQTRTETHQSFRLSLAHCLEPYYGVSIAGCRWDSAMHDRASEVFPASP